MTTLEVLYLALKIGTIAACVFGLIVLCVFLLLTWIAAGSPDVNGEKERDAGRVAEPPSAPSDAKNPESETICAWCERHISGPRRAKHGVKTGVSHGICPACSAEHFPDAGPQFKAPPLPPANVHPQLQPKHCKTP